MPKRNSANKKVVTQFQVRQILALFNDFFSQCCVSKLSVLSLERSLTVLKNKSSDNQNVDQQ